MDGGRLECPERLGCNQSKLMSSEKSSERKAISTSSVESVTRTAISSKVKVFDCNICGKMVLLGASVSSTGLRRRMHSCNLAVYDICSQSTENVHSEKSLRNGDSQAAAHRNYFGFYFNWCPPQRSEEQAVLLYAVRICKAVALVPGIALGLNQ